MTVWLRGHGHHSIAISPPNEHRRDAHVSFHTPAGSMSFGVPADKLHAFVDELLQVTLPPESRGDDGEKG